MREYKKYGVCYLMGAFGALWLKAYYSQAKSDELLWILAPTVGWVRVLSGILFEYLPCIGYVNHLYRFVIAPTCSGVQFLLIVFLMLVFSFSHRLGTTRRGMFWTLYAAALAYLYTILVNGIRITLSIYVPELFQWMHISLGGLAGERLHSIIGIICYFISLLFGYWLADKFLEYVTKLLRAEQKKAKRHYGFLSPVFWYFFVVLGVPFLNGAWIKNQSAYLSYAYLVIGICGFLLGVWRLVRYSFGVSLVNSRNFRIK